MFPCPTATSLPVFINPARPGQYRGIPKHSGFDFFWFFIDFAALRTLEIIEKPLENLGFCMVFVFSAISLPNQQNVAVERARTLKMDAGGAQDAPPRRENDPRELQDETQERQDGPSECPNGCLDEPWQLDLPLKVLSKANLNAPGSLRD